VADRPLTEDAVDADPIVEVGRWFDDAVAHGALQPEAMTVATADAAGRPSARVVLLRGVDARGFTFFTNYASRKGRELAANPYGAMVLHWPEVQRQVRATGRVEQVSDAESDAYWVRARSWPTAPRWRPRWHARRRASPAMMCPGPPAGAGSGSSPTRSSSGSTATTVSTTGSATGASAGRG
jgi:pyridoxamine 5'-phosphate oxidase